MVDRDVANAITIAMIAKVIEVTVILFITFSPSLVSQSVLVFPGFGLCEPKGLFTWYFDPSTNLSVRASSLPAPLTTRQAKLRTKRCACRISFA
jgi:hypothetical protein